MSAAELDALVRKRWRAQAEYVSTHSAFYRAQKLKGDLDELADLDFTDKEMLARRPAAQSAFRQLPRLEARSGVARPSHLGLDRHGHEYRACRNPMHCCGPMSARAR